MSILDIIKNSRSVRGFTFLYQALSIDDMLDARTRYIVRATVGYAVFSTLLDTVSRPLAIHLYRCVGDRLVVVA